MRRDEIGVSVQGVTPTLAPDWCREIGGCGEGGRTSSREGRRNAGILRQDIITSVDRKRRRAFPNSMTAHNSQDPESFVLGVLRGSAESSVGSPYSSPPIPRL